MSQECLSHDFSRESQWPELHSHFKYHNLLHVWTTRRVQKAVSGGRERVSDSDQTTDVVMRAPRSRRAPAAGRKKRVHRLPLLEGATCSVQIGERREETFLIRKHLLHLEAPCLRSKVIHRWVAAAMSPRGEEEGSEGEPGLAGNDIVNFTVRL